MGVEYVRNLLEFNSITRTSGNKLVVVDFYADWCGPCRAIAPLFEQLARQYEGRARFLKVDVDNVQDVAQSCGISAMPTFHFYKNGSRVSEMQGADPGGLQRTVEQYAPSSAQVSFAGSGQQLGGSAASGAPKVNWDAPEAKEEISKRREAIAAAAAQRYTTAPKKKETTKTEDAPAAAPSSSDAAPAEKPNDARLKVDQGLLQSMLSMGFPQIRAEKALILTGNRSIEPAMDWCFEHSDDADIDEPLVLVTENGEEKPNMTPEERKKRANEMLLKARKRREEEDKANDKEREKNRIRSGKQVTEARRKHEENERKRAVEAKRKEKREAAAEKKRVKELLEADKAARREKFNRKSAPAEAPAPAAAPVAAAGESKAVTGGVLQLRFSDGTRMTPHFEPTQTLGDVVDAIVAEKGVAKAQVKLATMYPKKMLTEEEFGTSLVELKLLPRGVLNVTI